MTLGVIGGSGLYEIDGLEDRRWVIVDTPWGEPSDQLLTGTLNGVKLVFLPRHGRGHPIPPSELNFRANIHALKALGCTDILSVSAVGSLREDLHPGMFVIVDQFIDRTFAREKSFFGAASSPTSRWPIRSVRACRPWPPRPGAPRAPRWSKAEPYMVMEGPQFSTRAESELYRAWGCHVIGMTNMPEAKLAPRGGTALRLRRHGHRLRLLRAGHDEVDVARSSPA
ncbi:MAG: hypothetical protein WDN45_09450 [Caulobacteraceae bacterium]